LNGSTGPLARFAVGLLGDHALGPSSGIMACMDDKPLLPGQWIDDLPEPLHTKADVLDLFLRVAVEEAKLLAAAIERASRN
jgi:hypothetical protein